MGKRIIGSLLFITLVWAQIGISADIPDLAAWWDLDDGAGTTVLDISGNDHHGEAYNDPAWVAGIHGGAMQFDGVDDRVEMPTTSQAQGFPALEGEVTWALWMKTGPVTISTPVIAVGPVGGEHVSGNRSITTEPSGAINVRGNNVGALVGVDTSATVTDNEWHHVAVAIAFETNGTSDTMEIYIDGDLNKGVVRDDIDINQHAGAAGDFIMTFGMRRTYYTGLLDDVAVFGRALAADEILSVMAGQSKELASGPSPANNAVDVLRDSILTWDAGEFAATHTVYLSTVLDEVSSGDAAALVSEGLADTSYDPGRLEFGTPYFWRVDEVNAAPDNTVFEGEVWNFTVEPKSLAIPVGSVQATASSATAIQDPNNTVNGSGLNENDEHSNRQEDMWLGADTDINPTIQFSFEQALKLDKVQVWNHNTQTETLLGFGIKEALIEYSVDGENWMELGTVELPQATSGSDYAGADISLDDIIAQHVKITALSNYSVLGLPQKGLSEVRFYYIPNQARELSPADGATTDTAEVTLSWRPGREAAEHEVYLGTDSANLALAGTTSENSFVADALDYAATYYWQVTEVNEAETPARYEGEVLSFATPEYAVIDDFEKYADKEGFWLWSYWADGFEDPDNGSLVGEGNIGETTIVHGGSQSMPIQYNNNSAPISEVTLDIDNQNWGVSGLQSLSLYVHGTANNTGQLYLKINDTQVLYAGLQDALQREQWIPWNIDLAATGADLANVTSLTLGIEGAGATGKVYIDDIRLYPLMPETFEPVIPDDGDPNLVAHYEFEGNANDSKGNYHGTAEGDPLYTDGKVGQALSLDNVDDHVVNTFDQEAVWPAYSVSLWVKTDLFNQDIYSSLFNNNSASSDFQIEVDGSDRYLYRGTGNGILGPVSSDWVHLTVSCDGVQTDLYYNGLYATTVNEANANFGQIAVGINRGMNNRFGGTIDEVRVYNRALSNAEAAGLAGLTGSLPLPF